MDEWEKRGGRRREGSREGMRRKETKKREMKGGHRANLIHSRLLGEFYAEDAQPGTSNQGGRRSTRPRDIAPTTSGGILPKEPLNSVYVTFNGSNRFTN